MVNFTHKEPECAPFVRLYERLGNSLDSTGNLNVDSTYRSLIEELRMQLLQIAADNLPAIYERDIAGIYLQYFTSVNDSLRSMHYEKLLEIAAKCPIVSGNAVYDAQALMRTLNPEIEYDWIANCENAGLRISDDDIINVPIVQNNVFTEPTLYPNPANELITIGSLTGNERIIIYNALGQVMKDFFVSDYTYSLGVTDLTNGIYSVTITGSAYRTIRKFIVIR